MESFRQLLPVAVLVVYSFSSSVVVEVAGFSTATRALPSSSSSSGNSRLVLFAEGGSPQYQKQEGILQRSEYVGKGSYLLSIEYLLSIDYLNDDDDDDDDDGENSIIGYEPGHVLALEIQAPDENDADVDAANNDTIVSSSTLTVMNEKTRKDLKTNDGWLRGPYTVSRGYSLGSDDDDNNDNNKEPGFQVLVKEVGYKSHVFATSKPGTPVRFGGKFKVPIVEGIRTAAGDDDDDDNDNDNRTKRVLMISTGVGVGPCVGAIEELLSSSSSDDDDDDCDMDSSIVAIDLIASFRTREETAMASDLDKLQQQKSNSKFHWKSVITGDVGRLSARGPDVLREQYLRPTPSSISSSTIISAIRNTHYHVIGNGQLVNEWTAGLKKAGVPTTRVTTEAYFNHAAEPNAAAIDTICEAILGQNNNDEEQQQTEEEMTTAASASA